jgi:hypothetical protein
MSSTVQLDFGELAKANDVHFVSIQAGSCQRP